MREEEKNAAVKKETYREAVEEALLREGCSREETDIILLYYLTTLLSDFDPERTMAEPPSETAALLRRVYECDRRAGTLPVSRRK